MAEPPVAFAGLLRTLRTRAGLTQEQLAEAASLSSRAVSDLERGINLTARKETARLLADALGLQGATRTEFEALARGRATHPTRRPGRPAWRERPAWRNRPGRGDGGGSDTDPAGTLRRSRAGSPNCSSLWGRRPRAGRGHSCDRRDGRYRENRLGGARRASARAAIPWRADLPATTRAYAGETAGRPDGRAGQPAADGRGRRRADPAYAGGADGVVARPAGRQAAIACAR